MRKCSHPADKVLTAESMSGITFTFEILPYLKKSNSLISPSYPFPSRPSQSGFKNVSRDTVVKHLEVTLQDLKKKGVATNNKGGTFSRNRREKWYHQTNASSINNLNSY
jgi:hypothetical protein